MNEQKTLNYNLTWILYPSKTVVEGGKICKRHWGEAFIRGTARGSIWWPGSCIVTVSGLGWGNLSWVNWSVAAAEWLLCMEANSGSLTTVPGFHSQNSTGCQGSIANLCHFWIFTRKPLSQHSAKTYAHLCMFIIASSYLLRCGTSLDVHKVMKSWRKCGTQRSTIQPQNTRLCHLKENRWAWGSSH